MADQLHLDPITVKTDLAEKYLKKYNNFVSWPEPGKYWLAKKYPNDKEEGQVGSFRVPRKASSVGPYATIRLVERIKENESLFYQLEYLVRNTNKVDFQNYILLMCQFLQCDSDFRDLENVDQVDIFFDEKTPLYVLGCASVTKHLMENLSLGLNIITTQKMAPICHLFVDLCDQLGWKMNLICINNEDINAFPILDKSSQVKGTAVGLECTGVVMESADIDSAVDAFVNSSVTAPWRLQRVYVQESVYEEVKQCLGARCRRDVAPAPGCGDAFLGRGKRFLCDALAADSDAPCVTVEAYRTAKELCGALRRDGAAVLSVWAADAGAAQEVALAAPARLVWINEYAAFRGPPTAALPLYSSLYSGTVRDLSAPCYHQLKQRWTAWNKFTKTERIDAIITAMENAPIRTTGEFCFPYEDMAKSLGTRNESFVSIDDGSICMGVELPPRFEDIIHMDLSDYSLLGFADAVANGFAVVYQDPYPDTKVFVELLQDIGVPAMLASNDDSASSVKLQVKVSVKKLKVIRSNYGTIFAN